MPLVLCPSSDRRRLYRAAKHVLTASVQSRRRLPRHLILCRVRAVLRNKSREFLLRIIRVHAFAMLVASTLLTSLADGQSIDLADIGDPGNLQGLRLVGEALMDQTGKHVANAGDVNGDGLDDVIVGAYRVTVGETAGAGRSYVVFGRPQPGTVQLSDIAAGTAQGFAINGVGEYDFSGQAVRRAGDVNGDGKQDLLVGAPAADPVYDREGIVYVVFGKSDTSPVSLADIDSGSGGFAINGVGVQDYSGSSQAAAGDVNGDGLDDVVIGVPRYDHNAQYNSGKIFVVFGKTTGAAVSLATVAGGSGGFVITATGANTNVGGAVDGIGDLNGDGFDDLLVGYPNDDVNGAGYSEGRTYVVFGKSNTDPVALANLVSGQGGFVINGEMQDDRSGSSVAGAGDINGDKRPDILIGAPDADPGASSAGKAYLVFGPTSNAQVDLTDISAGNGGFAILGEMLQGAAGSSVASAGDVDNDGLNDLVIGSRGVDSFAGRVYVVYGKNSGTVIDLNDVAQTGTGGFAINGEFAGDLAGISVGGGGDFNGDGLPDVVIGAPNDLFNSPTEPRAYVVFSPFDHDQKWVDFNHNGTETGAWTTPYNTVAEAVAAVSPGGTVMIKGFGPIYDSAEPITINKPMTLDSRGNPIRIAAP